MSKRGRPTKSNVRNRLERVLDGCGYVHGYDAYKYYKGTYGETSMRNVYYHLNKGVELGIFIELGFHSVKGEYTWGSKTERKYYINGPNATEKKDKKVEDYFKKINIKKRKYDKFIDWSEVVKQIWGDFDNKLNKTYAGSKKEKKDIMEEYGRIRAWLGAKDDKKTRDSIENKLNKLVE